MIPNGLLLRPGRQLAARPAPPDLTGSAPPRGSSARAAGFRRACPDRGISRLTVAFYQQAAGFELRRRLRGITRPDGLFIGLQRAHGYQAPGWPSQNVPRQIKLGAARPDFQSDGN